MRYLSGLIALVIIMTSFSGCTNEKAHLDAKREDGSLNIYYGNDVLFGYNFEPVSPPEGIDSVYTRSGFIHPVNTLKGHTLTRTFPEDHWHHFGIWNPWTHTEYRGDTLDFWNLNQQQGTVRFTGFEDIEVAKDYVRFKVKHEHVVLLDDRNEIALIEFQTIMISNITAQSYTIDFDLEYVPAGQYPFKILEYRYGGFGWRATGEWNNQNSSVLTSAGETRAGADGSLAEWVIVQGALGEENGGAILMGNPTNENHPEPIRVWPEDMYDRGDMFICMFPTKYADWEFEPGNRYSLKYRMVIFDGESDAEKASEYWNNYKLGGVK